MTPNMTLFMVALLLVGALLGLFTVDQFAPSIAPAVAELLAVFG